MESDRWSRRARWLVPVLAVLCLVGYVFVYGSGRAGPPIRSDGFSYYVYLPSWFIHGDTTLRALADDCCGGDFPEFTAIIRWPGTRRWVNAHPIGEAILQAPFFLAAHALTRWSNLSPDGFSLYYQHGAGLSGLAWTVVGLLILQRLLRRHFSERIAVVTLVALLFGTNLYHYATYDSSYSHPYAFALLAALLDLTERWHADPTTKTTVMLGLVCGLIVLTRHPNAMQIVLLPLYGVTTRGLRPTVALFRSRWRKVLLAAATAFAVVVPQLAIYYQATGRVLVSSYGSLGFDFTSPHVFGVLFGVQKGLFFWSPILLGAAAGLLMLRGEARKFLLPGGVILTLDTILIASWWDWQFGASYGHRGFTDLLPLFALGLAAFFEWSAARPVRRAAVTVFATVAIGLSVVQMLQYWNGVLPMSDTTWAQYRATFLRLR